MPAPTTARRLSESDLDQIRATLLSGRRPKVVFTDAAGQIAGQLGHVVELTDPNASEDWIVVRFGRDELPFSPTDLTLPTKSAPARRAGPPVVAGRARRAQAPTVARMNPAATKPAAVKPTVGKPAPIDGGPQSQPSTVVTRSDAAPGTVTKAARPAKAKVPASLVVTLTYMDREWTVAAQQGSKTLAKPHVIRPSDALRMVALLDVPAVHDAVESIIAAERAEAEGRAQRLRAELAEIESRLSELTHRP